MQYLPALEPADLWATSGVAIYEKGLDILDDPDPSTGCSDFLARVGVQQWWTTRKGLAIADYLTVDFDSCVRSSGEPGPYTSRRWRTPEGAEVVTVRTVSASRDAQPQEMDVGEDSIVKFATSGHQPVMMMRPKKPTTYLWPWGARLEGDYDSEVDYWLPWERFRSEDYRRAAPSMEYAAQRNTGPPEIMGGIEASYYFCFWTLMQTAAAPAKSALPRRLRRGLGRQLGTRRQGALACNLWVVDVPRVLPSSEPAMTQGGKHSRRYPVRGHWRNQYYPSIQGNKPIWINEHVRGPSGAPLHDARVEWAKENPVYRLRIPPKPEFQSSSSSAMSCSPEREDPDR